MKTKQRNETGFSLIELLVVTAIISILIGMISAAMFNARQRAYTAQATTEVQQIATALKSYFVAYGDWPKGFTRGAPQPLTKAVLETAKLIDGEDMFLEVAPESFALDNDNNESFVDPWGNPYVVTLDDITEIVADDTYQIIVRFNNAHRYYYQDY